MKQSETSMSEMKAELFTSYGNPDSVQVGTTGKPILGDDDILIAVKATTVTAVDSIFRKGNEFFARMATGPFKPKIPVLGTELSGIVDVTGSNVTGFKSGDSVLADSGTHYGAHAEFVKLSKNDPIVRKPDNLTFEQAASIPYGALTALSFLRDTANLQSGQHILILGASGSVGSYAVQLARHMGAIVSGVCSTDNVKLVRSLGADHVIDYKKENVLTRENKYSVIFDTVGLYPFSECKKALQQNGKYMTTKLSMQILHHIITSRIIGDKRAYLAMTGLRSAEERLKDLEYVTLLASQGEIHPVIDKQWPLEQIVEANRYVDSGRKKGNVVITVNL